MLLKLGFVRVRQAGTSHAIFRRPTDNRRTVVPVHSGKTIKRRTLAAILSRVEIARRCLDLFRSIDNACRFGGMAAGVPCSRPISREQESVSDSGVPLEAELENREMGRYHGYPMPETDPFRDIVLDSWREGSP